MDNIIDIADGFAQLAKKKLGIADDEVELLAMLRSRICNDCIVNGNKVLNDKKKCTICNCEMDAKWRAVNTKCIIGKW